MESLLCSRRVSSLKTFRHIASAQDDKLEEIKSAMFANAPFTKAVGYKISTTDKNELQTEKPKRKAKWAMSENQNLGKAQQKQTGKN